MMQKSIDMLKRYVPNILYSVLGYEQEKVPRTVTVS